MKLIFIKKSFSVHGGAENYMRTLMERLKEKADIHVIAKEWTESPGINFHKINPLSFGSFISVVSFNSRACRAINDLKAGTGSQQAGCVISFERTTCQDIYRAGEGCHKEWLRLREMTEPGWKRFTFLINPLHIALLKIEKKLFSNTKLIIANSNMVKTQIINHYNVPEEKIRIIYNGVDLKRFSPENSAAHKQKVRKGLSIDANAFLILFVGSGFERKGLKTLLSTLAVIKQQKMNMKLIVIGRGNIRKFEAIAGKYGIHDKVLFLGTRKDIERFYAAADLFVLPTIYDPFSNATLEALASGLPVITTKSNGVSELIDDGKEGFVIENPLDFNAMAGKIMSAFSSHKEMGLNSRLKAEKYPIEKAAEEFLKVIVTRDRL